MVETFTHKKLKIHKQEQQGSSNLAVTGAILATSTLSSDFI